MVERFGSGPRQFSTSNFRFCIKDARGRVNGEELFLYLTHSCALRVCEDGTQGRPSPLTSQGRVGRKAQPAGLSWSSCVRPMWPFHENTKGDQKGNAHDAQYITRPNGSRFPAGARTVHDSGKRFQVMSEPEIATFISVPRVTWLPSGKRLHSYGTSPSFIGKNISFMAMASIAMLNYQKVNHH